MKLCRDPEICPFQKARAYVGEAELQGIMRDITVFEEKYCQDKKDIKIFGHTILSLCLRR